MWTLVQALTGMRVAAVDGPLGRAEDVLFDERLRRGVHLVVDTRPAWPDRVLLVPLDLVEVSPAGLCVLLQRDRIHRAASIEADPPFAREMRARAATGVDWRAMAWGGYVGTADERGPRLARDLREPAEASDGALRSAREICGYHVEAADAELGRLRDVVLGSDWTLRGLVVDTGGWLFPERALVGYDAVAELLWPTRTLRLGLTKAQVSGGPRFDPTLSPGAFESRLRAAEDVARTVGVPQGRGSAPDPFSQRSA